MVTGHTAQQKYVFRNFVRFYGQDGLKDALSILARTDFNADQILRKWSSVCKEEGVYYVDFDLVRVYSRFVEVNALSSDDHENARNAIIEMDMSQLALILHDNFACFEAKVLKELEKEQGQAILKACADSLFENIQLKIGFALGEVNE